MNSLQEIRAEFIRVYEDIMRAKGLPTIMGRILAVLLLEERELNHKELSSLTGYSMASVNRTLNQLVSMGTVHKHKDSVQKHYVFHVNIDFPEMFAKSIEKMLKTYETQRDEINNLTQKLTELESKGKEQAEAKRLRAILTKFNKMLEDTMKVLEKIMKAYSLEKDTG
jgi:DNA-binding transcriptional regulator GbsR (MarR family)